MHLQLLHSYAFILLKLLFFSVHTLYPFEASHFQFLLHLLPEFLTAVSTLSYLSLLAIQNFCFSNTNLLSCIDSNIVMLQELLFFYLVELLKPCRSDRNLVDVVGVSAANSDNCDWEVVSSSKYSMSSISVVSWNNSSKIFGFTLLRLHIICSNKS